MVDIRIVTLTVDMMAQNAKVMNLMLLLFGIMGVVVAFIIDRRTMLNKLN